MVLIESGVTWLPASLWRIDKTWRGVRAEVPWLDRLPSEIVRDHVRLTRSPSTRPPTAAAPRLLEQLGSDEMLLFSTDYPHWHFDGDDALPAAWPADRRAAEVCWSTIRWRPIRDWRKAAHAAETRRLPHERDADGRPSPDHPSAKPVPHRASSIATCILTQVTPTDFDPFL